MASKVIVAVATRVTAQEAEAVDAFPWGKRADNLRVLLRYALAHPAEVAESFEATNGQPVPD